MTDVFLRLSMSVLPFTIFEMTFHRSRRATGSIPVLHTSRHLKLKARKIRPVLKIPNKVVKADLGSSRKTICG